MNALQQRLFAFRWTLAKVALPLVLLSVGLFVVIIPLQHQTAVLYGNYADLQRAVAHEPKIVARVDSLRADLTVLKRFAMELTARKPSAVPSTDSLRRSAERAHLHVPDLADEKIPEPGFAASGRLELVGNYADLLAWLVGLDSLRPDLQIVRLQWSQGASPKEFHLSGLVFGAGCATVHAQSLRKDSALAQVAAWKVRYSLWMQRNSLDANGSTVNPFTGHAPVVVAAKTRVEKTEAPKKVAPAPKLTVIGLVGGRMATVNTDKGERRLLRIGDAVGDWTVETITANSFVLTNHGQQQTYP